MDARLRGHNKKTNNSLPTEALHRAGFQPGLYIYAMSDYGINPLTGDYLGRKIKTLANAVYLRLCVPLGSWWGNPSLGSRLHELKREKDVPRIKKLAQQYAVSALQPLLDDGRADKIDITASQPHNGTCLLHVEVYAPEGRQDYSFPVKVA